MRKAIQNVSKKIIKAKSNLELTQAVQDLRNDFSKFVNKDFKKALSKFATKDDLKRFATKEDIKNMATQTDLAIIRLEMATKEDLEKLSTKEEMNQIANTIDGLAKLIQNSLDELHSNNYRTTRLENWSKKVGDKVSIKLSDF